MDRIVIYVNADADVKHAIEKFKDYICSETLADDIKEKSGLEESDLNGHKTGIDVEKQ